MLKSTIIIFILSLATGYSQSTTISDDGYVVKLNKNGTWEHVTAKDGGEKLGAVEVIKTNVRFSNDKTSIITDVTIQNNSSKVVNGIEYTIYYKDRFDDMLFWYTTK